MVQVTRFQTRDGFVTGAAGAIVEEWRRCAERKHGFTLVLSGGATPRPVYEALAKSLRKSGVQWQGTHVFFGDERMVPAGHPQRNETMARELFLDRVPLPEENVHPVPVAATPAESATLYEQEIGAAMGSVPAFDLVLLGMGPDGHTASLFPDSPALRERKRWAVAVSAPDLEPRVPRVTLTLPVLNAASRVLFLVSQQGKEKALERVLHSGSCPGLPAACVSARRTDWYIDASPE
ncbi:MAG: 6-phosphogluconolactonase [Desulfovibrionales bacterium]